MCVFTSLDYGTEPAQPDGGQTIGLIATVIGLKPGSRTRNHPKRYISSLVLERFNSISAGMLVNR